MSITPSHIIQYLYCPRYIYYEYVLRIPEYEEKYFKALKGRDLHERKTKVNREYLRKRLAVKEKYQEQYLSNELLRGQVDEVLEFEDGTMAPLDYKFAQYKGVVYDTYKQQLACYAWLIEDTFGRAVKRGYLVYTRSRNKVVEVKLPPESRQAVREAANDVIRIIENNMYPEATPYKKRCRECTFRNICTQI